MAKRNILGFNFTSGRSKIFTGHRDNAMTHRLITPLLTLVAICLLSAPAFALLKKGEQLPEVAGETVTGEHFSSSSLKGQPFLLKIGTTWCSSCGEQSKAINNIRIYMAENKVRFVEVFVQESSKNVRKYFAQKGFKEPDHIILDKGNISKKLNVYVIPRLILVDKHHQVYRDGDTLSSNELQRQLEQMLKNN